MMNFIKTWTIGVCLLAVASSMCQFFICSGALKRTVKFILALIMVFTIIEPFTEKLPDYNFTADNIKTNSSQNDFSDSVKNQTVETIKSNLNAVIISELKKKQIINPKAEILMDIDNENSIHINKVIIILTDEQSNRKEEIQEYMSNYLSLPTEVKTDG